MKFRRLSKWGELSDLEGLLFFAQKAEELLFDYTLDSYKPSALNAVFLCKEAVRLIDDIDHGLIDKANLSPVLEELSWSISGDTIAKSLLDLPAEKYILNQESVPLQKVRAKLEVLSCTLDPYRYLECCSISLIEAVCLSKKKDIDKLARSLFTTLINLGLHKSHLYEKTIEFFYIGDSGSIVRPDVIAEYLMEIYPIEHNFEILFLVSPLLSDVKDSAEDVFNIRFHDNIPDDLESFATANNFCPKDNELIVQVDDIRVFDCYRAREIAENQLGRLRDLFTLYHHKSQIYWSNATLVRQCCTDIPRIVGLPKNPIEKGHDLKPEKASKQLNIMLQSFRFTGRDFEKFNRAVDFHGLSVK